MTATEIVRAWEREFCNCEGPEETGGSDQPCDLHRDHSGPEVTAMESITAVDILIERLGEAETVTVDEAVETAFRVRHHAGCDCDAHLERNP